MLHLIGVLINITVNEASYFSSFETMKLLITDHFTLAIPFLLFTLSVAFCMDE